MRDIKFRAWDTRDHKMYYDAQDTYDYGNASYFGELLEKDSKFIVMQYTGLKDKKMVEVYDGDIGRFTANGEEKIGRVGYYGGKWLVYMHPPDEHHRFDGYTLTDIFEGKYFPSTEGHPFEVIGNIHANPKLLPCAPNTQDQALEEEQ